MPEFNAVIEDQPRGAGPAAPSPRRWARVIFYTLWTVLVLGVGTWLLTAAPKAPGLLIALDPREEVSWASEARRWLGARLELRWIYPWGLLAPYVWWLARRLSLEPPGLPWRAGLLLAGGVAFVAASQAVSNRLGAARPKALLIRSEATLARFTDEADALDLPALASAGAPVPRDAMLPPAPGVAASTPPEARPGTSHREVLMIRAEVGNEREVRAWSTNRPARGATNEEQRLAAELAPVLEAHLRHLRQPGPATAAPRWSAGLHALAYLAVVGIAQAAQFRSRLREREAHALRLESHLNQARLCAVQAQLQPHFLFNALNGIATLVRRDPRTAEEMVLALSDLLRTALDQSGRPELPLREELGFLDRYLELQQMRFGNRLRVEREIAPETLDALVPALLLQPLAENAIRHGLEPAPSPGLLRLGARRLADQLILEVADNGVGLTAPGDPEAGPGIGLRSVRERLAALYPGAHTVAVQSRDAGGVSVLLSIPWRPAPAQPAAP